jgi:hypothetical protein
MPTMGIISGILEGMAANRQAKMLDAEQARKDRQDKLQEKMLNLQMKAMEAQSAQAQFKNTVLSKMLGLDQTDTATAPAAPNASEAFAKSSPENPVPVIRQTPSASELSAQFANSTPDNPATMLRQSPAVAPATPAAAGPGPAAPGGGILSMLASLSPERQAALQELTGINLLGAGQLNQSQARLKEQQRHNRLTEDRYVSEEYQTPEGATRRRYRPMYGPPPEVAAAGGDAPAAAVGPDGTVSTAGPLGGLSGGPSGGVSLAGGAGTPANSDVMTVKQPDIQPFSYTDEHTGAQYEVLRNARTGQPVTKPHMLKPLQGQTGEVAGRITMAEDSQEYARRLKAMFVKKDGSINRSLILKTWAPMGGIGEGRKVMATFKDMLDGRQRAASGAAIPPSEVKDYKEMYLPSPLDNDATILDKFERMNRFVTDYLTILDPTGVYRRAMVQARNTGKAKNPTPEAIDGITYLQKAFDQKYPDGKAPPAALEYLNRMKEAYIKDYGALPKGIQ